MIASVGIALTPTFLCAMTGMALLVILDAAPTLGHKRSARAMLLGVLIISFSILCAILLHLRIGPLAMLTLATSAMLFLLPATLRIAIRARGGTMTAARGCGAGAVVQGGGGSASTTRNCYRWRKSYVNDRWMPSCA
ncbi:MAG: hypothetical protein AAEJ47_03065 [Planctomycetota bacterium]